MKKESNKWSIQITLNLAQILKEHCQLHGLKMNRFTEIAIITAISGSIYGK